MNGSLVPAALTVTMNIYSHSHAVVAGSVLRATTKR